MFLPDNLVEIRRYRPAVLRIGKIWSVEYYVYDPGTKQMSRKKIKINHIEKITERRVYALALMKRLNVELEKGWNPYIHEENAKSYALLTEVLKEFMLFNRKKYLETDIRESTILSYESYYNKLTEYLVKHKYTKLYAYEFSKEFINAYLDSVYKVLSSRTRDNYLKFLRLVCSYLVDKGYLKVSPAVSIQVLGKKARKKKNRTIIPTDIMPKLSAYLEANNKGFLLASQILYFCMIRPKEMTYIKVSHIDIEKSVIFVPGETAKNYNDAIVTIPLALNKLIKDMGVLAYPKDYYLFSEGFIPGKSQIREQRFAHFWARYVRKALGLPLSLKFYSLKDTGITDMITNYNDPLLARDQARHHDLSITELYTPTSMIEANEKIKNNAAKFSTK